MTDSMSTGSIDKRARLSMLGAISREERVRSNDSCSKLASAKMK